MKRVINLFVDICLLRAAPQDIPSSSQLLVITALLALLTGSLVIVEAFGGIVPAVLAQLMDLLFIFLSLRLALAMVGKRQRLVQSATALFATNTLINLVAMPLQLLVTPEPGASAIGDLAALLSLALMIWALVIVAHIVRHTFDLRFGLGLLISIGYFFLINSLVGSVFQVGAS